MTDTAQAADPVHAFIGETVAQNDVVLFMKGTPDQPRCGFSSLAVQILDHVGAGFVGVDVLQDEALRLMVLRRLADRAARKSSKVR